MIKYATKDEDSKSSPNNVIPLRPNNTSSTSETGVESLLSDALINSETETRLKESIEAAVLDACIKIRLHNIERFDDPFDAIYISELRADPLLSYDIKQIRKYIDIIDLSNTIVIEDGWED